MKKVVLAAGGALALVAVVHVIGAIMVKREEELQREADSLISEA